MSPLVVFAGSTHVVGTYVAEQLETHGKPLLVTTTAQDDTNRTTAKRPGYVRLRRLPGARAGVVTDDAMFTFEAYDDDEAEAEEVAELIRAILYEAPYADGSPIYLTTEVSGPQFLPDPETEMSRYTQTATVRLRGAVV